MGGIGFGLERPIIVVVISRKGAGFQDLFSDYFFIGGWPLAWFDLLKWRVSFVDKNSVYMRLE